MGCVMAIARRCNIISPSMPFFFHSLGSLLWSVLIPSRTPMRDLARDISSVILESMAPTDAPVPVALSVEKSCSRWLISASGILSSL